MSYAVRNSIILAILVILVNGIGWFALVMPTRKQTKKIEVQLRELDQKLAADANLYSQIEQARTELANTRKRWQSRAKILPRTEDTRISYRYLHSMVMRCDHPFPFDFEFEDAKDTLGMSARRYSFRADIPYDELFQFLYYFEMNKRLMVITEVQMDAKPPQEDDRTSKEMVTINTRMIAYAAPNGTDEIAADGTPIPVLFWNPFKALITEKLPKNEDMLPEVDRSRLVAITDKTAFIQDQQGALIPMKVGNPVYLGFVTRIDPPSATVEFTLNYGGFIRKRVLALVKESISPGQTRTPTEP